MHPVNPAHVLSRINQTYDSGSAIDNFPSRVPLRVPAIERLTPRYESQTRQNRFITSPRTISNTYPDVGRHYRLQFGPEIIENEWHRVVRRCFIHLERL